MKQNLQVNDFSHIDMNSLVMPMIVIHKNPLDFPGKYVARLFRLGKPTTVIVIRNTLREIRSVIPWNMVKLDRHYADNPVIIETWI